MSSLLYINAAENKSAINFGPVNLTKIRLLGGWTDVYFILMPIGCVIMSFQTVTLPALAGDQYDTRDEEVMFGHISHSSFMLTHAMKLSLNDLPSTYMTIHSKCHKPKKFAYKVEHYQNRENGTSSQNLKLLCPDLYTNKISLNVFEYNRAC